MKAPDAFRTISEVAEELDLPQHVLRFWETRFHQIKPMKRGGGRRYYRPDDVDLLRGIRLLLYAEGFTIRGVQRLLKENGVGFVMSVGQTGAMPAVKSGKATVGIVDPANLDDDADEAAVDQDFDLTHIAVAGRQAGEPPHMDPRRGRAMQSLSPEGRRRIEIALADLLEAKRLLDQVR